MCMPESLKEALVKKGWNPERIQHWGTRVNGSPDHLRLKYNNGAEKTHFGPFTTIKAGEYIAIVRFN